MDGSLLCELSENYFEPVVNRCLGGFNIIVAFIDTQSRKYMPWGVKALIHLGQEKLNL